MKVGPVRGVRGVRGFGVLAKVGSRVRGAIRTGAPGWACGMLFCGFAVGLAAAQPSSSSPLAPPPNGPTRNDPAWVALVDCTVHNPKPGGAATTEVLERATVVFRDGRIVAILPGERYTVEEGEDKGKEKLRPARTPLGPRVVTGEGLHVYPAFIDAAVEVDVPPPAAGPGRHFVPRVMPEREANLAAAGVGVAGGVGESLRAQGFGAAGIAPRGGVFRGRGAVVSLAKAAEEASASKPPVYRDQVYHSVSIERGPEYPDSEMGAIAVIRQALGDADWQAAARVSGTYSEGPNALDVLAPKKDGPFYLFDAPSELQLLRSAKIAAEFARSAVYVGSGTEYQRLDAVKRVLSGGGGEAVRLVLPVVFPKTPDLGTPGKQEATDLREMMHWEQAPTNARRLSEAGVGFALTTARLRDRGEFLGNVRRAVKHGLTKDEALASLTLRPAQLLGVAGELGSIDAGKRANLLVTTGDVFERKDAKGKDVKVRAVWIDGVEHEITPPPNKPLEGEWTIAFETKDPNAAEGAAAPKLVFDADNGLTVKSPKAKPDAKPKPEADAADKDAEAKPPEKAEDDKPADEKAADDKPGDDKPAAEGAKGEDALWDSTKASRVQYDGSRLSYTLDTRTPTDDSTGVVTVAGVVNWKADPPVYVATVFAKGGGRFDFTATREPAKAKHAAIGSWRVFEEDGNPRDPAAKEGLTIEFAEKRVTLTFTRKPKEGQKDHQTIEIVSRDVKYVTGAEGATATFTHELKKLGTDGKSEDTVTIEGSGDAAVLRGVSKLPDGTTHTYAARRAAETKKEDEDEAAAIAEIPKELPAPFGPYGLMKYPEAGAAVLTNATVWTLEGEGADAGVIEGGEVVIEGGKITYVGKAGAGPRPAGADVVDLAGKHVTPGIIDCHSHTGVSGGVNEGGQAVTSEVRIEDVTDPNAINWYRQLAGGVTAVNTLHGSANAIGGQSQTNKLRWGCAHPDDMHFEGAAPGIKFALGENPTNKNGGSTDTYPQSRMGVEMLIRDRFAAAKQYAAERAAGTRRRDLELDAIAEVLAGTRLVHCHSYRQDEIVMLCHVAKEYGFKIGTFQHILEGYKVADYVRDYSGGGSAFADWWAYKIEVQDAIPEGPPLMHEVGAVVSYNSDSDEMARRMNVEAAKAVKYGSLGEVEALKFVTLNAAKQLKVDDRTGSLARGKDADIAVWSGHPLSTLSRCEMTFVDGRKLFSRADDAEHRARIRTERARLIQKVLTEAKKKKGDDAGEAKPAGASPGAAGDRPARRRRPGTDTRPGGVASEPPRGADDADALTEEDLMIEAYYRDLINRGFDPESHRPGVCGCW